MTTITHHIPEPVLAAYVAGSLDHPFALVVATHLSLCDDCRASFEAHEAVGGALLEQITPEALSPDLKSGLMQMLDAPFEPEPVFRRAGVYPGPVMEALKGRPPRWKRLGGGVRQTILSTGEAGSARLLYIPAGQAVPDHGHNGMELTLVLQGSFRDETGKFRVGDLEIADDTLEHTPVAEAGADCICLAATDAPLRFSSMIPRLLQPIFRI